MSERKREAKAEQSARDKRQAKRERRQREAGERQAKRDKRTDMQQLATLRIEGHGHCKEADRLHARILAARRKK